MKTAWYKRKEWGLLGHTYPVNWKGWVHLASMFAAPVAWLGFISETGLLDAESWLSAVVAFLLFFGIGAIGWVHTEIEKLA